ncbi:hypothetical protein DFH09DRAFT_1128977 [Mycena vulgaris]|nr:hypothetical protein DFH09DRAFT_1128977 [Mycena vulgaris]
MLLEPDLNTTAAVKWALRVIPSVHLDRRQLEVFIHQFRRGRIPRLTPASFADYLFCVNCFLTGNRENMDWMDKMNFQTLLISDLFQNLTSSLMEKTISNVFAGEILRLTAQLADQLDNAELYHVSIFVRTNQVYTFCSAIPRSAGWLEAVSSAIMLARGDSEIRRRWLTVRAGLGGFQPEANHAEWVHAALNHVEQLRVNPDDWDYRTSALDGLLQALWADPGAFTISPPKTTLRVILWALSTPGNIAEIAFDLLWRAPAWFQDVELQVMMQQCSVWQLLGRVATRESLEWSRSAYFELGQILSNTAHWEPIVRDDLAGWITAFLQDKWTSTDIFNTVLVRVWLKPGNNEVDQAWGLGDPLALIFEALAKAWEEFDIIQSRDLSQFCRLAKCTALAALRNNYGMSGQVVPIPAYFKSSLSTRLRDSLIQAAENARGEINSSQPLDAWDEALTKAAKILEQIGTHIPCNDSGANLTDIEMAAIHDEINASVTLGGLLNPRPLRRKNRIKPGPTNPD